MSEIEGLPRPQHSTAGLPTPKHPLRLLVKRFSFFFLFLYLLALALWIAGNLHEFLDSTQALLLSLLSRDALLLAFFSLCGMVLHFFPLPGFAGEAPRGRSRWLGLGGYLLLLLLGLLGSFLGSSVLTLAAGLH